MENKTVLAFSRRGFSRRYTIQRSCLDAAEGKLQSVFSIWNFPAASLSKGTSRGKRKMRKCKILT